MSPHLLQAANAGAEFRATLKQTDGFQRTKWFDTLQKSVKPAVLAVVMAAGATGCSTMSDRAMSGLADINMGGSTSGVSENVQIASDTPYGKMVAEVTDLDNLPRHELADLIQNRQPAERLDHIPEIEVTDLAAQVAENFGFTAGVLDEPKALLNPFQPNKQVQVSQSQDWSANLGIATDGFGMGFLYKIPGTPNPFALNGNHIPGAVDSFDDPSQTAHVIVPERMEGSLWDDAVTGVSERNIAFTLFHELAHTTFHQEMMLYGGENPANESVEDAFLQTYKIQVEAHSNVAASMAIYKAYDMSPEAFQDFLTTLEGRDNMRALGGGMSGAPEDNNGLSMYRSSQGVEVLSELVERDPHFLKNLSYEAIPLVAYDIVEKAGYFHNAAELIANTMPDQTSYDFSHSNSRHDSQLIQAVRDYLPVGSEAHIYADYLERDWQTHSAIKTLHGVSSALSAFAMLGGDYNGERDVQSGARAVDSLTHLPDVQSVLGQHIAELKAAQNAGLTPEAARSISQSMDSVLAGLPTIQDLSAQRMSAIELIQEALVNMSETAKQADPSSVVAHGSGESATDIASYIQSVYGDQYFRSVSASPNLDVPGHDEDEDRLSMSPGQ
ncbi:hypothetical protein [Marinobacter sp. tcs-11]|uniref:hypothetical protein n=1 Tax=Marinobacter sp. tcs-11 TaxID=1742860 RepID=UPI00257F3DE8|nr:hypothetical protein [Marinobacter sp. tcs-11]